MTIENSILLLELLELGKFLAALLLGFLAGRWLSKKFIRSEFSKGRRAMNLGLAALFALISVICMFKGSNILPIWIGRNIVFFTGYYLGLVRWRQ